MSIYGLILAAGRGERFGSTKQLAVLDGKPLLQHAVDAFVGAGLDAAVIVLGHDADHIHARIEVPPHWRVVVNRDFADGQSTSLVAGLDAAPAGAAGVVVTLGDQPRVRPDAIRALVDAHAAGAGPILRAAYRARPGHPLLFDRAVWDELRTSTGDGGARALLARRVNEITYVEMGGDPPADVDTTDDLVRL